MKFAVIQFFMITICLFKSMDVLAQPQKTDSTTSFVTVFDIRSATKDGYYLEGYIVDIANPLASKLEGKKIRVTGNVTIVKGLDNQPEEYDKKGNVIIKQGRNLDTKHILNPVIEVLE